MGNGDVCDRLRAKQLDQLGGDRVDTRSTRCSAAPLHSAIRNSEIDASKLEDASWSTRLWAVTAKVRIWACAKLGRPRWSPGPRAADRCYCRRIDDVRERVRIDRRGEDRRILR